MSRPTCRPWGWMSLAGVNLARVGSWLVCGLLVGLVPPASAQMPEPQLRYLSGHTRPVYAVGYSPDGRLLVSASVDGTLRVWDRTTGQPIATVAASSQPLLSLAVHPQGQRVAVSGIDGVVRQFDLSRPYPVVEWGGIPAAPTALAASADARLVLTGDAGGTVRWWDSQTKAAVRDFAGTPAPVVSAAVAEGAGIVFSLGADGGVRSWQLADGQATGIVLTPPASSFAVAADGRSVLVGGKDGWLRRLTWPPTAPQALGAHGDVATSVTLSPDGKWWASGGVDQQVQIYQAADGKLSRKLGEGPGRITQVVASGDSQAVIAAGEQGAIKAWEVAEGRVLGVLAGHTGTVTSLAAHPQQPQFATAGADGTVRLWDLPRPRQLYAGHTQPVRRVTLAGERRQVWSLGGDQTLRSWRLADGQAGPVIDKVAPTAALLASSGDDRWIVAADPNGDIVAWPREGGGASRTWGAHLGGVTVLARDAAGPGWLSAGADGTVKLWSAPPAEATPLAGLPAGTTLAVATADDRRLVVAQADGTVLVVDRQTKKVLHQWPSPRKSPVTALQLSPGDTHVWAADAAGRVRAWQLADGQLLADFSGGAEGVTSLALHPREPLLATTTSDGEVRLWRTDTKDQVLRAGQAPPAPAANAPPPSLLPLSSSADGLRLAAAAPGGQVTWMTVADGKPVRDELKLTAPPRTLAQRPDGSELVAGDALGKAYLAAAGAGAPLTDWQAHEGAVTGTSYHPSGGQVATSGADGVVRVWQLPVPASQPLGRHAGKVTALATSPDGARVYTAGGDGHLKSVELASGKDLFDVESPGVTSLAVSADQLVLGASDAQGGVSLRGADGVLALRLHAHTGAARSIAFPPRPAPWVSVGDDGTLRVWDAPAPPRVLTGHTGPVERLALSPHGQTIATASTDKTVRLWNLGDGAPSWTLAHDMPVRALAWKGDSQQLATVDEARRVRVWNLADGQQLAVLEGHAAPVVTLAWGPDGTLVSASADGQLKFWNVAEKKETAQLATGVPLVAAAVVAAPPLLVTGHTDGTLKTWQWADRQPVASWPVGSAVEGLALSADGKLALVAANDKSLRQFAVAGGAAGPVVANLPGPPRGLSWSADGQKFAATLPDGSIRVWSVAGELLEQLDLGPSPPRGIAFTPDAKGVVVGSDDQRVRLARLLAMKKVTVAPQPLTSVAFSSDATTVVVGARDKSVSVWNVSSGAAVRSLAGCTDAVTAVAISPDGSKVFATGLDKQLRCWLLADGQLQFTYPQPAAGSAVRVSRDGQRVAVTLADGAVRVLDVATGRVLQTWLAAGAGEGAAAPAGEPLAGAAFGTDNVTLVLADHAGGLHRQTLFALTAFPAHPPGVTALAWSPNGQHLVTAGADKQVKVHDLQGKVVATMQGGEFDLVSLALRRDGGQTAGLTRDNQLAFWQNANGQLERKIALPWPATYLAYTLDSTRVVVAGAGEYHVYLVASGRWVESGVLPAGPVAVAPVQIVPPGGPVQPPPTHLACLGSTGQLTVRRLPWERVLTGHMGAATACTFTPDGVHLITAGADKTVRLWTAATGAAVRAFPGPTEAQSAVATSADGGRVASAGADKTIRIWNTADGALVSAIILPAAVRQLATAPGSSSFVALGEDQIVRLVDWKSGREARRVPTGGTATAVAQSASQQVVWVGPELGGRTLASELPVQWLADAGKVLAATFLPDGQQCATCGEDRIVKIWKRDGTLVKSLTGYPVPPTGMAVSPDGSWLAVAGQVGAAYPNVGLWRLADGQALPPLATPAGVAAIAALPGGRLAVAGVDQHLRIYGQQPLVLLEDVTFPSPIHDLVVHPETGALWVASGDHQVHGVVPACRRVLVGHQGPVGGVAYAAGGRLVVTSSQDRTVRLWDAGTGEWLATCAGSPAPLGPLAVSSEGERVAVVGGDNQLRVWSLAGLKDLLAPRAATAPPPAPREIPLLGAWAVPAAVRSLSWDQTGSRLATGGDDNLVQLWDVARAMPPAGTEFARAWQRWSGPAAAVTAVQLDPSGKFVISASADKSVTRWTISVTDATKAHAGPITEIRLASAAPRLFTTGADKLVRVADPATLREVARLEGAAGMGQVLAVSGDGSRGVVGEDQTVRVWQTEPPQVKDEWKLPAAVVAAEFSLDGERLFVSAANQVIYGYRRAAPGKSPGWDLQLELKGPASPALRLSLAADQRTLYSAHADQGVRSWLVSNGTPRTQSGEPGRPVYALAYSPDGQRLVSGGADRVVRLWETSSGKVLASGREHTGDVQAVAPAPRGQEWASASADGTVQLWDAELQPTRKLTVGLEGRLHAVAWSQDGQQLLVGGSAKAWQAFQHSSLLRVRHVEGHNDTLYRLVLNPAGNRLATLDFAGHLVVWDLGAGGVLFHQQLPEVPAFSLAYAPDGTELAVGTRDARVVRLTIPPGAR